MLVGARDHQHVVAGHPHVPAEDVGGHTETGHVADVARAVGVRPGDGGQDMGHGAQPIEVACQWFVAALGRLRCEERQRRASKPPMPGEVEVAVPGPLELEEARVRREGDGGVPDAAGVLAPRDAGQHRPEERGAGEGDGGGADVVADLVHALVVGLLDRLVVRRVVPRVEQLRVQPGVAKGCVGHLAGRAGALHVDALAHRRVERKQGLRAHVLLGCHQHPDGPPSVRELLAVVLGDVLVLVEVAQAHQRAS